MSAGLRPAGQPDRLAQVVKLITEIGSMVALGTALLYYFGWIRTDTQAREFGTVPSVFDMSTQDYVLRSMDVLFIPILLLLLAALLGVRLHRRLVIGTGSDAAPKPGERRLRRLDRLARVLRGSWLLPFVVGGPILVLTPDAGATLLPFLFAMGILGTWYGSSLRRFVTGDNSPVPMAIVVLVGALLAVTLFWVTERVARIGGEARAEAIKADVAGRLSAVTIYSAQRLYLDGPGVVEVPLGDPDAAFRYRYDGLHLLQRSGGKFFLLTEGWGAEEGRLIALRDDQSIRLEFGPGSAPQR